MKKHIEIDATKALQVNLNNYRANYSENVNFGYHSVEHQTKFRLRKQTSVFKIGFEAEKEDTVLINVSADKLFRESNWRKERDGSLGTGGFELVSPTFNFTSPETLKADLHRPIIQALLNANYSENCGNHFHISHTQYSTEMILSGIQNYLPLLYAMYSRRKTNSYCRAKNITDLLRYPDKYSSAFLTSYGTLEFRIFPALANVKQLEFRLNLINLILGNMGDSGKAVIENCVNPKSPMFNLLNTVYKDVRRFEALIKRVNDNLVYSASSLNNGFDFDFLLKVYKPKYQKFMQPQPQPIGTTVQPFDFGTLFNDGDE